MLDSIRARLSRLEAPDATGLRAPYALPPGVPALQEDPARLRRRLLLGLAVVAVVAGTAGFAFGRRARADDSAGR